MKQQTQRELRQVLAALAYWQSAMATGFTIPKEFTDIANGEGIDKEMSMEEIGVFCNRLRSARRNPYVLRTQSSTAEVTHGEFLVDFLENGIESGRKGYGEHSVAEGYGRPVVIEMYEGDFRVIVFSDINKEDPTHIISMAGALESNANDSQ